MQQNTEMFEGVYAEQHKHCVQMFPVELERYRQIVRQQENKSSSHLLGRKMQQTCSSLTTLYGQANRIRRRFISFMEMTAKTTQALPFDARHTLKDVFRAMEKAALRKNEQDRNRYNNVYDVVRGALVYATFKDIVKALEHLTKEKEIVIDQIKDRFQPGAAAKGGWSDLVLSCHFADSMDAHVFEIQIHHKQFAATRAELGGHSIYAIFRCVAEALEVAGIDLSTNVPPQIKLNGTKIAVP